MGEKYWGDPIMSVRLPSWMISGIKLVARKEKTTASELIRDMVAAVLAENGITEKGMKVIEGQIKTDA